MVFASATCGGRSAFSLIENRPGGTAEPWLVDPLLWGPARVVSAEPRHSGLSSARGESCMRRDEIRTGATAGPKFLLPDPTTVP